MRDDGERDRERQREREREREIERERQRETERERERGGGGEESCPSDKSLLASFDGQLYFRSVLRQHFVFKLSNSILTLSVMTGLVFFFWKASFN